MRVGGKGWEVTRSSDVGTGRRERRNTGVGTLLRKWDGEGELGGRLAFGILRYLSLWCAEVGLKGTVTLMSW